MVAGGIGTTHGDPVVPIFLGGAGCRGGSGIAPSGFDDLARANASRTHANPTGGTVNHGADTLEIRNPPAVGLVVRVAHVVPEDRPLATNITRSCHISTPTAVPGDQKFCKPKKLAHEGWSLKSYRLGNHFGTVIREGACRAR